MLGLAARLLIVLISGLAIWDGVTFVIGPSELVGAVGVFLKVGAIASVAFALAGVAIAWLWPESRPGQLLGWCMALAAFTWIDVTLAPLAPDSLPYSRLLGTMGPAGGTVAIFDRVSLALLVAALARFALLFPRPVTIGDHPTSHEPFGFPGARIAGKLDRFMSMPLRLPQMRGLRWLHSWLDKSADGPPHPPLPFLDWMIKRPGQVWLAAASASAFVSLALLTNVEPWTTVAWAVEYFLLMMLAVAFINGLRLQYASGGKEDQERLLWIVEGVALGSFSFCLWALILLLTGMGGQFDVMTDSQPFLGLPKPTAVYLTVSIMASPAVFTLLSAIAAAAFYRGAIDPRLAIRRTTVYGGLGVLFLFLFAGLGNVAEGWLEGTLGVPTSLGTLMTGGTVAVVLIPVKHRMDRFMTRILPASTPAETPRQTTAILFSDIVGYTRLTGEDQKTALTMMTVFHKAADRIAREHRGRVVKTNADEVMLEFKLPTNAVRAASQLQEEFHEAAKKLGLPTPGICTGIHFGEVTRSNEGDLFGDAVNIASRLEGIAEAGQIVLSAAVAEQLDDATELEPLGPQSLKNVAEPVECSALLL